MNILHSTSSFLALKIPSLLSPPCLHSPPLYTFGCYPKTRLHTSLSLPYPPIAHRSPINATVPSDQEAVSVIHVEDFVDKDWSVLDTDTDVQKIDRIISAGSIVDTSKVLVSVCSEAFVDRVVDTSPCDQLLVVHDSLCILACIKEKYDKVNCWQGDLIDVPEKWTSFDVVFLYFLPALPFELDQFLAALANRCLPGARIVLSHPQGRKAVEEQHQQYPDVVVSNLPDKLKLESSAADHSFEVVEFADEPGLYLAVLRLRAE